LNRGVIKIARSPADMRDFSAETRGGGKRIGLVPTMGALHEGHASLIRLARERTNYVVVSIFVNPKQFGPKEDLHRYPRDEAGDVEFLARIGCDLLFAPSEKDLYSSADRTRVSVEGMDGTLCGASRPGHFQGVALVVAKLFNIVQPDEAYFGQKDAQQAVILQRMAADLDIPVRIVIGPTVREGDGLALSSRNRYLTAENRTRAITIYVALHEARRAIEGGERNAEVIRQGMSARMERAGIDVDYADVVDGGTLRPVSAISGLVLLAAAGIVGGTRLIDNIAVRVSGDRVEEAVLEFPEWSRYEWKR
jgi:pantoate--beta-alanine ligase